MKIGFIGAGNMGGAILQGMLKSGRFSPDEILVSRKHPEKSGEMEKQGIKTLPNNRELAAQADVVVLAVKPVYASAVLSGIRELLSDKLVISIMAGWTYEMLEEALPSSARFVRVMPNTPLAVGEGMSVISRHAKCSEEEFAFAQSVFEAAGKVAVAQDDLIYTAANGVSGCGPAFAYAFIEALADGGVRYGVPRNMAYQLAAQTLIGAGKMVLETQMHPGALKDAVCSPGGTTIEGMFALEKGGMRAAVMDAVGCAVEKTLAMGKK